MHTQLRACAILKERIPLQARELGLQSGFKPAGTPLAQAPCLPAGAAMDSWIGGQSAADTLQQP